MIKVLVINGPNLNLLGTRQPEVYGTDTLADLEAKCIAWGNDNSVKVSCIQSNSEGDIVDAIQKADKTVDSVIINAGAYTHTSIAIRDAISGVDINVYEVHISNIHSREEFRKQSYISGVVVGVVCGFGLLGYKLAIETIALKNKQIK